jgi:SAM-dependent methyltransferase
MDLPATRIRVFPDATRTKTRVPDPSAGSGSAERACRRRESTPRPTSRGTSGGAAYDGPMTPEERWLAAIWPVVRDRLPAPEARVLELGCGSHGGLVPVLLSSGYDAIGVDPDAPEGDEFRRVEFERFEPVGEVDVVVASASLHHVEDPVEVLDRVARLLAPDGRVIVIEWDWQAFDEQTAEWCFGRLDPDVPSGWLHRHRDRWSFSAQPWADYLNAWAAQEGIHPAGELVRLLDERFRREHLAAGPYLFADLACTSEDDERAAIAAGEIRATRVDVVCRSG